MAHVTPIGRASYANVFEAKQINGEGDPKFSLTIIFDKDTDVSELKKLALDTAVEKFGEKTVKGKKFKWPFRYGNDEYEDDPNYEDTTFIRLTSMNQPKVVDAQLKPIMSREEFYSGCYCRVSINPFTFDHPTGGKGVSFGLNNVMKVKDGEPLGAVSDPTRDFADFADDTEVPSADVGNDGKQASSVDDIM